MTRHIDFEGIENFRDFGGYDTVHGRPMKLGVLYRSANHAYATEADLRRMADLGLAAIIDLRRKFERDREPSKRWPGFGAAVIENDILSDHADWADLMKGVKVDADWFFQDTLGYNRRAPFEARHIDLFSRYFRTLAETEGAIVVHCAAGKDRTGVLAALTLCLLGVPDPHVAVDYARSERAQASVSAQINAARGPGKAPPPVGFVVCPPEAIMMFLTELRRRHGSVAGFAAHAGVTPEHIAALRDHMLD